MTRVWSLAADEEPPESQLYISWKSQSKLLSFDSGYESFNSFLTNQYELQQVEYEEDEEEQVEYEEYEHEQDQHERVETISFPNRRVQSSPIPIPRRRKYNKTMRNRSQNSSENFSTSSGYSSLHALTSTSSSLSPETLSNDLIGHPPCNCGCIRGYRNPYLVTNISLLANSTSNSERLMAPTLSSPNDRTESSDIESERSLYPLPDIVSSSLSQNSEFTDGILREIGADLRRISKDFITTRNRKIETKKTRLITRLTGIAILYILTEVKNYLN